MTKYNKLIRDRIPSILENKGIKNTTIQVSGEEKLNRIIDKVQEEVNEFIKDSNIEEIGDIIEILRAFCDEKGITWDEVEAERLRKLKEKGGFKKGIILLGTEN